MTPVSLAGFTNMTAMSSRSVTEPFAATRDGFVIAEGAAVLILEAWEVAEARGATILAEVLGGASTADAHHITAPSPRRARRAVLHGDRARRPRASRPATSPTSTPTARRRRSTTPPRPRPWPSCSARPAPPSRRSRASPGTRLGAAGAIEAVAVVESMRRRLIPPTAVHHRGRPRAPRHRPRDGRGPGLGARPDPVQQLRLRRPQRHPRPRTEPASTSCRLSTACVLGLAQTSFRTASAA